MIFDTHAHYDDEAFDEDREEIFKQFPDYGIGWVTDPGSTKESLDRIVALTRKYPYIYGGMGIHPSECADMTEKDLDSIREKLQLPRMVAVGEIGLDYHWDEPDRELQKKWFRAQIDLAKEENKPIIIHSRDAAADTMQILKETHAGDMKGVMHCYSYSAELAETVVKMGFYIGVGGVVTFKNARKLKETVARIPIENIVLETDSPYLAPVPNRGKRNTSLNLIYVAEAIAEIKEISKEEVIQKTMKNACRLYRLQTPIRNI